jgi:hypothetical protein
MIAESYKAMERKMGPASIYGCSMVSLVAMEEVSTAGTLAALSFVMTGS